VTSSRPGSVPGEVAEPDVFGAGLSHSLGVDRRCVQPLIGVDTTPPHINRGRPGPGDHLAATYISGRPPQGCSRSAPAKRSLWMTMMLDRPDWRLEMDAPMKVREQLPRVVRFSPREIRKAVGEVEGFNAKLALVITRSVGTMACAYLFGVIALISLPAAITSGQVIVIVAWIAQTFLQLVLLSIIMVGQTVQSVASDARAAKEFADTETILDRLDINTAGGIRDVLDAIHAIGNPAAVSQTGKTPPARSN
jgi:hypothetical protein